MPRVLVLLAASVAGLAFATSAQAAIPMPTVSIGDASVRPALLAGSETELAGGPTLIIDGFGLNPPTLVATAGATVTITTDMAVDSIRAWVGREALAVTATGERTDVGTLPAGLVPPTTLQVGLDVTTATHRLTSGWTLNLAAPPPPPPPPPPVVVEAPDPPPALAPPVRLAGRRLTAAVTCAADCAGTLTLKASGRRVARWTFTRAGTLRFTISPSLARRLRGVKRLRAVLTPAGGAPTALSVPLKRPR